MIPNELRAAPQWFVSGSNKIPISVKTGHAADVRDSSLYATYDEAFAYASANKLDIGFALTRSDPFVVIDLDAAETDEHRQRHQKIFEAFDTYAELSRSQKGVHIWCRGSVPRGVRRDKVEMYPADRYIICTGITLKDKPITDQQAMLDILFQEIDHSRFSMADLEEREEILSDQDIFEMAMAAINGEKFDQLSSGRWQGDYPSQSEADFALMNILCFYTKNNEQVKRLFRYSALGRREKAQREPYLEGMIKKIRSEEAPEVEFNVPRPESPSNRNGNHLTSDPPEEKKSLPAVAHSGDFTLPPGFVGELARYIYDSSVRPVHEIATAGALAACAGLLGRQFNIDGMGLNQYIMLIAETAVGKEGANDGIQRLFTAVADAGAPIIREFYGPSKHASGQGLIKQLAKQPCFVSVLGEFGYTLRAMADTNYGNNAIYRQVLLDVYTKSGANKILGETAYSDNAKNTPIVASPALTLLVESTPGIFFGGLSMDHLNDGFIPRFLLIEYKGDRPDHNENAFAVPPAQMVQRLAELFTTVMQLQASNRFVHLTKSPEAQKLFKAFDKENDKKIRGLEGQLRDLWGRGLQKALKVAGLIAIADRPHEGIINAAEARWAIEIVKRDIHSMATRFEAGDVGRGETVQIAKMRGLLENLLEDAPKYPKLIDKEMVKRRIVPYAYIQQRAWQWSAFKEAKNTTQAIKETVEHLIEDGTLEELPKQQVEKLFNRRARMFHVKLFRAFGA